MSQVALVAVKDKTAMEIDQWRREYLRGGLNRDELQADPVRQFEQWLQEAVEANLSDPSAMSLATVDSSGQPSQRIVLLKGVDQRGFVFFTNLKSHKGRDIAANPQVSLLFPWQMLERQVIVYGRAERLSDAESDDYFQSRPRDSQIAAWASHQSKAVESRAQLEQMFETCKAQFAEQQLPRPAFWGGFRIIPTEIEFWQGRGSRLHDRFIYRQRQGTAESPRWTIDRLCP